MLERFRDKFVIDLAKWHIEKKHLIEDYSQGNLLEILEINRRHILNF